MARIPSGSPERHQVNRRLVGERYEQLALTHLTQAGLTLIARNVTYRHGELDLIMQQDATIVFIEVRFRRSAHFGGAAASVTSFKQQRLLLAATHWLAEQNKSFDHTSCRFDVFAITGNQVEWIVDAFNNDI